MKIRKTLERIAKIDSKESKYIYRIVEEEFKGSKAFGIEVERQDTVNGDVVNIERDKILKISNDLSKVENLLNTLSDNQVSPIHLVDVLGEYVDEYVSDFDNE